MANRLENENIESIELYIFPSTIYTFENTLYVQMMRKVSKPASFNVVNIQQPIHHLTQVPFVIVNSNQIVSGLRLKKFLKMLVLRDFRQHLLIQPILNICSEIAAVALYKTEQQTNPFYLFISPWKKLQYFFKERQQKNKFEEISQYFSDEEINKEYFLYKLQSLTSYAQVYEKNNQSLFGVTCLYALVKTLRIHNQFLYKCALACPILQKIAKQGLKMISEIKIEEKPAHILYAIKEKKEEKKQKYVLPEKKFYENLVKSLVVTGFLLKFLNFI